MSSEIKLYKRFEFSICRSIPAVPALGESARLTDPCVSFDFFMHVCIPWELGVGSAEIDPKNSCRADAEQVSSPSKIRTKIRFRPTAIRGSTIYLSRGLRKDAIWHGRLSAVNRENRRQQFSHDDEAH